MLPLAMAVMLRMVVVMVVWGLGWYWDGWLVGWLIVLFFFVCWERGEGGGYYSSFFLFSFLSLLLA